MSADYTPGPWCIAHRKGVLAVRGAATEHVAQISSVFQIGYGPTSSEEAKANARLIAASPELLEALQSVMAEWRDGYGLKCAEQCRAAIAKATAA
ncbi:hypothetical protein [Aureimonas glaciei]|uniref:Uncharacterized protein n=1 Tax=Aureimonas glaciei TaxID=1776957 RepID=A0A916XUK9_9HYPH|nr:hypothetical protein [Aureimonas glaciei]GGD11873.1 hypothetical protein GCM10011335_13560 [Aureimonas glaciei]